MHHRAAPGLAATSIHLSLVIGVGISTERSEVFQLSKDRGLLGTNVLDVVKAAVSGRAPTQVALGASTGGQLEKLSANDQYWCMDSRFAVLNRFGRQGTSASGAGSTWDWKKALAAATSNDEVYGLVLAQHLAGVSRIIKSDVANMDSRKSLPVLGFVSNDLLTEFAKKVSTKIALVLSVLAWKVHIC